MSAKHIGKNEFQSEVMESAQSVLVDFFAEWCGPCRMMSPVLDKIAKEHPEIKVLKVNVDENPELAERFGVMSIPTLIVFKQGKIVHQATGARPENQILAML